VVVRKKNDLKKKVIEPIHGYHLRWEKSKIARCQELLKSTSNLLVIFSTFLNSGNENYVVFKFMYEWT
jgi:hypothetical protein